MEGKVKQGREQERKGERARIKKSLRRINVKLKCKPTHITESCSFSLAVICVCINRFSDIAHKELSFLNHNLELELL